MDGMQWLCCLFAFCLHRVDCEHNLSVQNICSWHSRASVWKLSYFDCPCPPEFERCRVFII